MEEADISPNQESERDEFSMPNLIVLAESTMEELNRFRQDVLKNYQEVVKHRQRWITGYMAAKMLSITDRTLRRYRLKYKLRVKTINGICRYYYPDLLSLLKDTDESTVIKTRRKQLKTIKHNPRNDSKN